MSLIQPDVLDSAAATTCMVGDCDTAVAPVETFRRGVNRVHHAHWISSQPANDSGSASRRVAHPGVTASRRLGYAAPGVRNATTRCGRSSTASQLKSTVAAARPISGQDVVIVSRPSPGTQGIQ